MQIDHLDHLVLTVQDIGRTCAFYARVLGMRVVPFDDARTALAFGEQKINLHERGAVRSSSRRPRAQRRDRPICASSRRHPLVRCSSTRAPARSRSWRDLSGGRGRGAPSTPSTYAIRTAISSRWHTTLIREADA